MQNKYQRKKRGAIANSKDLLEKYKDVVDLVGKSDLSLRRIAQICGQSVNTVKKVKSMLFLLT